MDLQREKCVIVIDEHLPLGMSANTAAILGMTLGIAVCGDKGNVNKLTGSMPLLR